MKTLLKIIFLLLISFSFFTNITYAENINLNTGGTKAAIDYTSDYLIGIFDSETDLSVGVGGEKGIYNSIIRIARDLKNLFFMIAGIYFLIIVIKLLFSSKTADEVSNFKKGIIWISLGIIVTQISYSFARVLFDKDIDLTLAKSFVSIVIEPLMKLLETAAGFFFLAMMIYAFFRIVTANGDEEKAKGGKMTVLYAGIGFIIIKISAALVRAIYGTINTIGFTGASSGVTTNIGGVATIVVTIINWMNGFIGIIVILMIIYAGFLALTSFGDEEKLKKSKHIIIYIIVGLLVLVTNYLILTFFIKPESAI